MTRVGAIRAALFGAAFLAVAGGASAQQPAQPAAMAAVPVGYVQLTDDPRYDEDYAYARIQLRALGRPLPGVELGIADAQQIGKVLKVDFSLKTVSGGSVEELASTIRGWTGEGVHFVVTDLPTEALVKLADLLADAPVLLFNVTEADDSLRGAECRANVAHTYPSYAMLTDALAQYLVSKNWKNWLVLQGPLDADRQIVEALKRSAQRFGGRVTDVKPFLLTNDPRLREQSNVALMTAGSNYDVVYVADSDGEFGRYVPYETNAPRPVVGTAGLIADAWHWAWERQGAPQVNSRFEKLAGRRMTGFDWAAWAAVRSITAAVTRAKSTEYGPVRDYLLGDQLIVDGVKGNPMSFRSWDHQLRQPLLVGTYNAIIERPPMPGFLHQTNDLDTLGVDAPETKCRF